MEIHNYNKKVKNKLKLLVTIMLKENLIFKSKLNYFIN